MKHNYRLHKGFLQNRTTAMLGSFFLPFRHLPLDHPWIDSIAPCLIIGSLFLKFPEQTAIPFLERSRRGAVALWQPALEDLEASQEREPIRVKIYCLCRLEHQGSHHEMAQRKRINLLDYARWSLASQLRWFGCTPRVVMGLLLVKHQLLFPSLVVKRNQFHRRIECFVEEICDQNMFFIVADPLGVVQRVADHPDDDPIAVFLSAVGRSIDLGQIRAISQISDRLEGQHVGHPRQDLHVARRQFAPQFIAEKVAVPEQEHVGSQMAKQARDHSLLAVGTAPYHEADLDVSAKFDQAQFGDLRKSSIASFPGRGTSESGVVGFRVGDIKDHAINAHQAQSSVESPWRVRLGQRTNNLLEQVPHRSDAQPSPGHAKAGAMGSLLANTKTARMLEDLDWQVGQQ